MRRPKAQRGLVSPLTGNKQFKSLYHRVNQNYIDQSPPFHHQHKGWLCYINNWHFNKKIEQAWSLPVSGARVAFALLGQRVRLALEKERAQQVIPLA